MGGADMQGNNFSFGYRHRYLTSLSISPHFTRLGAKGNLTPGDGLRFWARRGTLQISPVHSGLCTDPQAALGDLFEKMARTRRRYCHELLQS
jgi:hypothetical protein